MFTAFGNINRLNRVTKNFKCHEMVKSLDMLLVYDCNSHLLNHQFCQAQLRSVLQWLCGVCMLMHAEKHDLCHAQDPGL